MLSRIKENVLCLESPKCKKEEEWQGRDTEALNSTRSFTVKRESPNNSSYRKGIFIFGERRKMVIITLIDFISRPLSLGWIGIEATGPILILFHRLHFVLTFSSPSICTFGEKEEKQVLPLMMDPRTEGPSD